MRFVAGRGADKACCRQRRCGEAVAGRGPSAQRTAGRDAAAKSHREDVAGQGRCSEEPSGRRCRPGVPWRRGWRHCGREPSGRAAGRGTLAELLAGGAMEDRGKRARQLAPARKAICRKGCTIGKTLQAGTLQRRAIGKQARKEPQLQAGKEHPALHANKKESGKAHSLKPALVMTALVRVTGARPRGSSQLLLCSLELLW